MRKLGFGCMRFPMKGKEIDQVELNRMVDLFMGSGFYYFDTAHGYVEGKSEAALRESLVKRYPRESYLLADKLTSGFFEKEGDILPLFEEQLENCGVEYFDYYLMHALNSEVYKKYVDCHAFEVAAGLKKEGKIRHVGISFHDKACILEKILKEQKEIEVVQIQFNYADYADPGIESARCYEVCVKYGKPVIVMEPVKGGALANLPEEAKGVLNALSGDSHASYAIRFAATFEHVMMVLSGMSNQEQVNDNLSYMKDFVPFTEEEFEAVKKVTEILKKQDTIACTACHYCTDGCPKKIRIPDLFACFNSKKMFQDWNSDWYYGVYTQNSGKASDCIRCGKCEKACPQHLPVRERLKQVAGMFENKT